MRVLTQNVLGPAHHDWDRRLPALVAGLRAPAPDVVALQEAVDVPELPGPGWHEAWHSRRDDDGTGAVLASRWPIGAVHDVDGRVTGRARELRWSGTVVAEVRAPDPIGPFLAVHHTPLHRRGRRIDYVLVRGRPQGPTLQVRACERTLVEPVDEVQRATTTACSPSWWCRNERRGRRACSRRGADRTARCAA